MGNEKVLLPGHPDCRVSSFNRFSFSALGFRAFDLGRTHPVAFCTFPRPFLESGLGPGNLAELPDVGARFPLGCLRAS